MKKYTLLSFFLLLDPIEAKIHKKPTEKLIITGQRLPLKSKDVMSSLEVLTREDLKKFGTLNLDQALRVIPGVDVTNQGGHGRISSVFIRGTNSEHTLVFIDGIKVNDPVSPNKGFNFAHIEIEDIEKIEIIKGAQSVLYGSDALGGVILITTSLLDKDQTRFGLNGGSDSTYKTYAQQTRTQSWSYHGYASYLQTQGFSSALVDEGGEKDSSQSFYSNLILQKEFNRLVKPKVIFKFLKHHYDIDRGPGANNDDPNSLTEQNQYMAQLQNESLWNNKWSSRYSISSLQTQRKTHNDPDTNDTTLSRESYFSRTQKIEWNNFIQLDPYQQLTVGFEWNKETAEFDFNSTSFTVFFHKQSQESSALFSQYDWKWNHFLGQAGIRYDHFIDSPSSFTYKLSPGYYLTRNTLLRASVGRGFKSPSLFQLYDSTSGNKDLQPESSWSWELGLEQELALVLIDVTYFENHLKQLINTNNSFKYINIDRAKTSGFEAHLDWHASPTLAFSWRGQWISSQNLADQSQLLRRPYHKNYIDMNYTGLNQWNISTGLLFVGSKEDTYSGQKVILKGYQLLRLNLEHRVHKNLRVFLHGSNLLDQDYQEVVGYSTAGLSLYMGLDYHL